MLCRCPVVDRVCSTRSAASTSACGEQHLESVHLSVNCKHGHPSVLRANVTCAAFEVDSSALAATYIAEADALLAPFAARRL